MCVFMSISVPVCFFCVHSSCLLCVFIVFMLLLCTLILCQALKGFENAVEMIVFQRSLLISSSIPLSLLHTLASLFPSFYQSKHGYWLFWISLVISLDTRSLGNV